MIRNAAEIWEKDNDDASWLNESSSIADMSPFAIASLNPESSLTSSSAAGGWVLRVVCLSHRGDFRVPILDLGTLTPSSHNIVCLAGRSSIIVSGQWLIIRLDSTQLDSTHSSSSLTPSIHPSIRPMMNDESPCLELRVGGQRAMSLVARCGISSTLVVKKTDDNTSFFLFDCTFF